MKVLWHDDWMSVRQTPAGDNYVACSDAVLIVAVDEDDRLLLVEEPSPAFGVNQLGLPGGAIDEGEDALEAAQRELREETGFGARSLETAGKLRPWSKYLQMTSHLVVAAALYPSPLTPDEPYPIILRRKTRDEVKALITTGEICDAQVIAALKLTAWLDRG
jgi:ADP-ribose diphosphatase